MVKENCFVDTNLQKEKTAGVIPSGNSAMPVWFVVKILHMGGVARHPPISLHLSLSLAIKEAEAWLKATDIPASGLTVRFIVNPDGSIMDTATSLIWHPETAGPFSWETAQEYCRNLGEGWRCPTDKELELIVDRLLYDPASAMPGIMSFYYWSSTPYRYDTPYVWCVSFSNGYVFHYNRSSSYYVRAVRGGQWWWTVNDYGG